MQVYALGLGIGTRNAGGDWLEVYYPQPLLAPGAALLAPLAGTAGVRQLDAAGLTQLANEWRSAGAADAAALAARLAVAQRPCVLTVLADDSAPDSVPAAYLKLQLISHRQVKPHETDLGGIFGILPNVAWTNSGAVDLDELPGRQLDARLRGEVLSVDCVDKFPKMTDYVVPAGVRIADTARVRLGAYVGEGTTVMHEGFINFNAGTIGPGMIEGRISAGVLVGAGSDLGGGCSTMGTLSGGGSIVISIGKQCLIGANAGVGIPLGDRCTVEAGLYITAGTKVTMLDAGGRPVETLPARQMAGMSDLLFRRNSLNGAVECLSNRTAVELNAELHRHN
jgi:2,3,4,5-tetrahydropyridine-2-carboxylate N-succinyltransferase